MTNDQLKEQIGDQLLKELQDVAQKEIARSLQMPLKNKWGGDQYFQQSFYSKDLIEYYKQFEALKIEFSPSDIVHILFKVGLLFAVNSADEYSQRAGGRSLVDPTRFALQWHEKSKGYDALLEECLDWMVQSIRERTLIVEISNFKYQKGIYPFIRGLSVLLEKPIQIFLNDRSLKAKLLKAEPHFKKEFYTLKLAKEYFCSPSVGFTVKGTSDRAFWYAAAWSRAFLHVLRISSFAYTHQMDFGESSVKYTPPIGPVFLGEHTTGGFCWEEDRRAPWEKVPDGNLFLSYGYRGIANMQLDERNFPAIEKMFGVGKIIFDNLNNPYSEKCLRDIWPTLEILNSATQATDLGTKILLQ
jgi:hypothetical protein